MDALIRQSMKGRRPRWFWRIFFFCWWWSAWCIGNALWAIAWPWWRIRWCWQYVTPFPPIRYAWWCSGERGHDYSDGMDPAASVELKCLDDVARGHDEERP